MCSCCHDECHPRNFGLEHKNPALFVNSQWPMPPLVYVIWRVVAALYFVIWIILSGAWPYDWYTDESDRVKWFIFLTNWMFFVMTVTLIVQAVIVVHAYVLSKKQEYESVSMTMPWYYKLEWVMYNVSTNAGLVVSILFWGVIYSPERAVHPVDFNTHGTNSIYLILDLCITGMPVRVHHFFHGLLFSLIYIVFSAIYTVAGGTNSFQKAYIYSVMDWNTDPGTAAMYGFGGGCIGSIVIWLIVYALYWLRVAIYRAACKRHIQQTAGTESKEELGMQAP